MKLTLNVNEDKELRKEVKNIVKSAVDGIFADEVRDLISKTIEANKDKFSAEKIEKEFYIQIKEKVSWYAGKGSWDSNVELKKVAAVVVKEILQTKEQEISKVIEGQVAVALAGLTNAEVDRMVTEKVKKSLSKLIENS